MIVQIVADAGHVGDHRNAMRAKQVGGAEPRQLQELRRVERAGCDDDFAACACAVRVSPPTQIFDAGGALALEQDARRERLRHDVEIGAAARGFQIGRRGRGAHAAARGGLVEARAFLRRAVEIVVARIAALQRGLDEGLGERMRVAQVGNAERAVAAVEFVARRARCLRPCGNTAAHRQSPSRCCRAGASGRSLRPGRGYRSAR